MRPSEHGPLLTQKEFAKLLDVSSSALYAWSKLAPPPVVYIRKKRYYIADKGWEWACSITPNPRAAYAAALLSGKPLPHEDSKDKHTQAHSSKPKPHAGPVFQSIAIQSKSRLPLPTLVPRSGYATRRCSTCKRWRMLIGGKGSHKTGWVCGDCRTAATPSAHG